MARLVTRILGLCFQLEVIFLWYTIFQNVVENQEIINLITLMMIFISLSLNIIFLYGNVILLMPFIKKLLEISTSLSTSEAMVIRTGMFLIVYLIISQAIIDLV